MIWFLLWYVPLALAIMAAVAGDAAVTWVCLLLVGFFIVFGVPILLDVAIPILITTLRTGGGF